MKTSDFDFELPNDRIAQRPAEPRESARLLDVRDGLAVPSQEALDAVLEGGAHVRFHDGLLRRPRRQLREQSEVRVGSRMREHLDGGRARVLVFSGPDELAIFRAGAVPDIRTLQGAASAR